MELRHLRYFCAVAEFGTFGAASKQLHVSQSAISEQIADLEREVGGALLDRTRRLARLTPQGELFLLEARKTLAAADRAVDVAQRALSGQEGSLAIGFFLWGAGGFFSRIIREYRQLYPKIKLTLYEMHVAVQVEALQSGKIDIGFTRPLEPPIDRVLRSELIYNDPVVVVLPRDHRLATGPVKPEWLANERFVMLDRQFARRHFDGIVTLCSNAGFSPNIVSITESWPGVLTLVESGEGIALVPSGVRYLLTPGLVVCDLVPQTTHVGISVAWNPANEGPIQQNFLRLVLENREQIQRTHGG
ncbi:transcriptional regulator, LysR family [Granulicella rosea]|uniref:Transcriptional regulator, LysR family n=1 Tax=Granulicella rosea TaxID=474952 RepID=A0A239CTL2_9BACT|nr:LysR family transcriptional regulator [Granulicella rosea]SNS23098.1 transcriptional regulator, LysR family [Granulicella rosea]